MIPFEGYEPKLRSPLGSVIMDAGGIRAQSLPVVSRSLNLGNPWYSEKTQAECELEAARPTSLPFGNRGDGMAMNDHLQSGMESQPFHMSAGPTGKGRGGGLADALKPHRSAVGSSDDKRTEGAMPDGAGGMQSMGPVNPQKVVKNQGSTDELQRALEGELVTFLRDQNSRLLSEVAALRNQLEKSWVSSSPWSAIGGTSSGDSHAPHGRVHNGRQGRDGSRTPRGRGRDMAVSPEFQHQKLPGKYTPNGTRVPDGPPPEHALPPVPPIPFVEDAVETGENQLRQSSFVSGPPEDGLDLYDTCESKPKAKNGDASWKPVGERDGVLPAREAKQMWLEREVRSLKVALDRVAIPPQVQQSPYWNSGFDIDGKIQSNLTGHANAATGNRRSASGGCGEASLQARAASGGCGEDALHGRIAFGGRGEISPQARAAIGGSGDVSLLDRAATGGCGDISLQDRAFAVAHDHQRGNRASSMHGDLFAHDRAPFEHGDLRPDDRAFLHRGDLYGQGRAPTEHGEHLGRARAFAEHGGGFDGGRACRHDVDIKIFATNLGMVWGEVETEMESKRGAHFLPGLRMRVE